MCAREKRTATKKSQVKINENRKNRSHSQKSIRNNLRRFIWVFSRRTRLLLNTHSKRRPVLMFYLELDCLQDGEISSPRIAVHGQIIFDRLLQLESKN